MEGEGSAGRVLASSVAALVAEGHPVHPKRKQPMAWHFAVPAGTEMDEAAVGLEDSTGAEAEAAVAGPVGVPAASPLPRDSGGADAARFVLMGKRPP